MDGRTEKTDQHLQDRDDYLWNASGHPYPEIKELEELLEGFRGELRVPNFPAGTPVRRRAWFSAWLSLRPALGTLAVAATIVLAVFLASERAKTPVGTGWDVTPVEGRAQVGTTILSGEESARLAMGQILETDDSSRATLNAADIGQIEVEPNTRIRLLNRKSGLNRLALDRGTIRAFIWSPPGQFVVDTPGAMAVDLGCSYTLQVDDSGAGLVQTSLGWVGFKLNGRESFIPAGAACATRPKVGPGTPYMEDASVKFREALTRFDFEDTTQQQWAQDLAVILRESRKQDALTLWHLLSRSDEEQRVKVYDRLQALVPAPTGVSKDGILRLDRTMLDAWWNELGFDDIGVWRQWERNWSDLSNSSGRNSAAR
ncbi:MAG: FecR domain-containing protein [Acidobacteriaceae bacterium]